MELISFSSFFFPSFYLWGGGFYCCCCYFFINLSIRDYLFKEDILINSEMNQLAPVTLKLRKMYKHSKYYDGVVFLGKSYVSVRKQSHKLKCLLICSFEIFLLVLIIIVIGQKQFKVFVIF